MGVEIERKFLVKDISGEYTVDLANSKEITQYYLSTDPVEIRVRHTSLSEEPYNIYEMTIKLPTDDPKIRKEFTINITEDQYKAIESIPSLLTISKIRYNLIIEGEYKEAVIDIFETGKILIEVEFDSIEQAENFVVPECFGDEVTNDEAYKNVNLAIRKENRVKPEILLPMF